MVVSYNYYLLALLAGDFLLVHTVITACANRINELKAIETVFISMYWIPWILYWLRTSGIATNHGTQHLFIIPNTFWLLKLDLIGSDFCPKFYSFQQYFSLYCRILFFSSEKRIHIPHKKFNFVSSQLFEWKKHLSKTLSFFSVWIDFFCVILSKDSSFIRDCSRKSKSQDW